MLNHYIQWGILGTSPISNVMANAIKESSAGQLRAIGSRAVATADMFSRQVAAPKSYTDYQQLLDDPTIDAVYIGLPNHYHKEWIIRAAKAGKHILCEKPLVLTALEAKEVILAVEEANVICMEALMYRFHPFTKKIQELIQNNIIGDIKLYTATYTANITKLANPTAGGSIRNLGCYPVSLVRLLANAEPIAIRAMGRKSGSDQNDNQASVILKFANDSMAVISTADDLEMFAQFDLYGTKGSLKVITNPWLPSLDNNKIHIFLDQDNTPVEINVTAEKSLYTYQIDAMNENILHGNNISTHGISLADSLGNAIVLEQWLEQISVIESAFTQC